MPSLIVARASAPSVTFRVARPITCLRSSPPQGKAHADRGVDAGGPVDGGAFAPFTRVMRASAAPIMDHPLRPLRSGASTPITVFPASSAWVNPRPPHRSTGILMAPKGGVPPGREVRMFSGGRAQEVLTGVHTGFPQQRQASCAAGTVREAFGHHRTAMKGAVQGCAFREGASAAPGKDPRTREQAGGPPRFTCAFASRVSRCRSGPASARWVRAGGPACR